MAVSLSILWLLAGPAAAFWRLPCGGTLVNDRADPIVNPGGVAGHVHQIMGGNGFDFTMNYSSTQQSTCTTCKVKGDMSNYWTPNLYFQYQNGSFEKVDQVGGGLIYYLQRPGPNNEPLKAFPEGLKVLAGSPVKRSAGTDFASQAISYNCLNYYGPPEPETGGFPTHNCPSGLRSQVFFPSCWDGKNLDSPDHKSHMAYPIESYNGGSCPSTHPVHMISLFYEIIWDTNKFASQWYGDKQPFVWSNGDPTGYGFHGDFVNGWKTDILQKAIDTCTNDSGRVEDCPVFQLYDDNISRSCKLPQRVSENIRGPMSALPGCNPVQAGPDPAKPATGCTDSGRIGAGQPFFKDLTGSGWSYQGCGYDDYFVRTFTGASTASDSMTLESCATFCSDKGFSNFGTEYSKECYCSNSISASAQPQPGLIGGCNMPCAGDGSEFCGDANRLSIYQKCSGSTCTNAAGTSPYAQKNSASTITTSTSTSTSSSSTSSTPSTLTTTTSTRDSSTFVTTRSTTTTTTMSKRSQVPTLSSSQTTTTTTSSVVGKNRPVYVSPLTLISVHSSLPSSSASSSRVPRMARYRASR